MFSVRLQPTGLESDALTQKNKALAALECPHRFQCLHCVAMQKSYVPTLSSCQLHVCSFLSIRHPLICGLDWWDMSPSVMGFGEIAPEHRQTRLQTTNVPFLRGAPCPWLEMKTKRTAT